MDSTQLPSFGGGSLRPLLAAYQRIDREIPGLAMDLQLEAILEQRLQHEEHLGATRVAVGFGLDLILLGIDPRRTTHDLKRLNRVRVLHEQPHVARRPSAGPEEGAPSGNAAPVKA